MTWLVLVNSGFVAVGMMNMWHTIVSYIPDWKVFVQAIVILIVPIFIYLVSRWLQSALGNQTSDDSPAANKSEKDTPDTNISKGVTNPSFTGKYEADLVAIKQRIARNCDVHVREFTIKIFATFTIAFYAASLGQAQLFKNIN
ncbi:hypothetical protein J2T13_005073 [Paenibacillus sp. DS2015]|uniref:hypothetical protein n=1 Tax=Paenibacillus sp. DS2015 TaxID=3373917 RepID=UPI003D1B94C3